MIISFEASRPFSEVKQTFRLCALSLGAGGCKPKDGAWETSERPDLQLTFPLSTAYSLLSSGAGGPPRYGDLRSGRRDGSLRYLFEDYAFDTDRRELHRGPAVVSVAPLAFDLLEYLIRNRDRVVSKDEVLKAIWKGRIVSDEALTTRLNAARGAIGDCGEKQRLIKTLPRRGFRFVGAVQEAQRYASAQAAAGGPEGLPNSNGASLNALSAPPLSIVVLPFANIGGGPEQDYFVDGVTECLTTDLSRIGGSFVIARNSAFSYKGKAIDVRQVGRELNVRYVLEGSVQRGGNRLRVNVQMIDAETGNHLWAERFDKPVADLLDMQDEIVSRLANALDAQLVAAEARRAERSPHPDATDLCFQGAAWLNMGRAPENMAQARGCYERALALEPGNVEALVGTAWANFATAVNLVSDDRVELLAAAEAVVTKALSLAPNHPLAHYVMGIVQIFTNRAAQGIAECERALGAGSEFGPVAREHRGCEVSSRSGRGNRSPCGAGAPSLSPRYTLLCLEFVCWSRRILAGRRRRSACLAAPEP